MENRPLSPARNEGTRTSQSQFQKTQQVIPLPFDLPWPLCYIVMRREQAVSLNAKNT